MTENIIINELLTNTKYFSTVYQNIKSTDFSDRACKQIYKYIGEIYKEYNKSPNLAEIELYVESKAINVTEKSVIRNKIDEIKSQTLTINKDIIIDSTEKYIKGNRFYNDVVLEGAKLLEGESKLTQEDIQKIAEEINMITFKQATGLDYINDAEKNFLEYQAVDEAGIKSSLNLVNVATGGGYKTGTLNVYASVSNGGKCCRGNTLINIYLDKETKNRLENFLNDKYNKQNN